MAERPRTGVQSYLMTLDESITQNSKILVWLRLERQHGNFARI